jgi:hypothetical protein
VTERVESTEISDENNLLPELELSHTRSCYGGVSKSFKETVDRIIGYTGVSQCFSV